MFKNNRHRVFSFLMILLSLTGAFKSRGRETKTPLEIPAHKLPLLPQGQHLGYIEGFNPDNSPKLRKVMDGAFAESVVNGMRVARIQMDWTDLEPTKGVYHRKKLAERLRFAHSKGLAIYLLLCSADTDSLNYPKDLLDKGGTRFAKGLKPDAPVIVARYKSVLDWAIPIAKRHGVYCISVGNEPDTHFENDSTFMTHFLRFVSAVRDHAHTIDSDIAITYTSNCDPVTHPERGYGKDIADAVDIFCFNLYGYGDSAGFDRKATEETLRGMLALSKGKPVQIQELGCSSICNPDRNWKFHKSSYKIQSQYFDWAFKRIKSTKRIRAAYVFQLVENSPYIDKWYAKAFAGEDMSADWVKSLCSWLKGLGLIRFDSAKKKPAWKEFMKALKNNYSKKMPSATPKQ
ncbi:MAG: hypothetical protein KAG97_11110 [Victivallales bacterium]|nr:hypothetical protein [Victivallales bacterium]